MIEVPGATETREVQKLPAGTFVPYLVRLDDRFHRAAVWHVEEERDLEVPGAVDVWGVYFFDGHLYASYTDKPYESDDRWFHIFDLTGGEEVTIKDAVAVNDLVVLEDRLLGIYTVWKEPRYEFDRVYDLTNGRDLDVPNTDHIWEVVEHDEKLYLCCEEGVWCIEEKEFLKLPEEAKDWWGLQSRGCDLNVTIRGGEREDRAYNLTRRAWSKR